MAAFLGGWELLLILLLLAIPVAILAMVAGLRLVMRRNRGGETGAGTPPPLAPAAAKPEKVRKAKRLILFSRVLAASGLTAIVAAFFLLRSGAEAVTEGGVLLVAGLGLLVAGAVVGQIGRGLQGRVI